MTPQVPLDTESARAFYQERLAVFAKNVGLLVFIFWCFSNAILSVLTDRPSSAWFLFLAPTNRATWAFEITALATWLATRSGARATGTLRLLDGTFLVLGSAAFVGMGPPMAMYGSRTSAELLLLLVYFTFHWLRALLVPSSARLTAALTGASSIPLLVFAWVFAWRLSLERVALMDLTYIVLWCALLTTCATLTSRVIYGLREEVREARTLGQYTLVAKIGEGGMGTVYRARHAMLRRPTAIKILDSAQAGERNLARFEREVQLTSRLTHPNTVAVFDYGRTPDGVFYYAMEYLDGLDLQAVVELDGPQPPSRVVHVLVQVCAALAEAHGIGLVHRDIKPANVLLCTRGGTPDVAKVLDFGLVKQLASDVGRDEAAVHQTGMGTIVGTPLYMSPEAIVTPDAVDARSDLYAVGALGWFLLVGRAVFAGATPIEVCSRHLHERPRRPSEVLGAPIDAALEDLLLACLAKAKSERPADAEALRDALLAVDVPAWTRADALAWWARVAPEGARRARAKVKSSAPLSPTLAVDLRARRSA